MITHKRLHLGEEMREGIQRSKNMKRDEEWRIEITDNNRLNRDEWPRHTSISNTVYGPHLGVTHSEMGCTVLTIVLMHATLMIQYTAHSSCQWWETPHWLTMGETPHWLTEIGTMLALTQSKAKRNEQTNGHNRATHHMTVKPRKDSSIKFKA